MIIRGETILAAGALLPLAEMTIHTERFGTRHRAALGITEQTDAVVIVVSEENSQVSLVERARIVRNLSQPQLTKAIRSLLRAGSGPRPDRAPVRLDLGAGRAGARLSDLGRLVGRAPADPGEAARRRPGGRRPGAAVRRLVGLVVYNWPLKLAAIALAFLLYAGLVVSQSQFEFTTPVPSRPSTSRPTR